MRRTLYVAHLNLAQAAWQGGRIGEVLKLLDQEKAASPDLRGFEWHYLKQQCNADLRTLKLPGLSDWATFSADGSRFASLNWRRGDGAKRGYTIWETSQGREVAFFPFPDNGGGSDAVFSADGSRLAMSLGYLGSDKMDRNEFVIVDATTGHRLATNGLPGNCRSVAFRPDGKQVAAVVLASGAPCADLLSGDLIICDAATGRQLHTIPDIMGISPRPAYSPDGARIAVVSQKTRDGFESEVKVWDIVSGHLVSRSRWHLEQALPPWRSVPTAKCWPPWARHRPPATSCTFGTSRRAGGGSPCRGRSGGTKCNWRSAPMAAASPASAATPGSASGTRPAGRSWPCTTAMQPA